mmetsp:Transcript_108503/g.317447  ORF Transcript_108503/g.317447 Transcript_108503/m.317447 type:complete len:338 (+) Transcript_108503:135-1148(+)
MSRSALALLVLISGVGRPVPGLVMALRTGLPPAAHATTAPSGPLGTAGGSQKVEAQCGVVMMASGQGYAATAMRVANRTSRLSARKGWCPLDSELDHVPVTLFTDIDPLTLQRYVDFEVAKVGKAVGTSNLRIRPIRELPPWEGPMSNKRLKGHLGNWMLRWYHAQIILAAPYTMVTYLDVDALPCTAHGITRLMEKLISQHAFFGAPMVIDFLKCQSSAGDCAVPHPGGINAQELRDWTSFTERNSGVMVMDMRQARPIAKDFASAIVRHAGNVSGDQFALREALFIHRHDVPQLTFNDSEVCRYRRPSEIRCETEAKTGCAIHHLPQMGSLQIMR